MSDKPRYSKAPYPDVDDALADTTRPTPTADSPGPTPPPAIPGADADVRPLIDGRERPPAGPAPSDAPQTAAARDPKLDAGEDGSK